MDNLSLSSMNLSCSITGLKGSHPSIHVGIASYHTARKISVLIRKLIFIPSETNSKFCSRSLFRYLKNIALVCFQIVSRFCIRQGGHFHIQNGRIGRIFPFLFPKKYQTESKALFTLQDFIIGTKSVVISESVL